MRRLVVPLAFTLFAAMLSAPFIASAEEPLAPYEGRPLPQIVKQLLWEKSCDIPMAEMQDDTCVGEMCNLQRSSGSRFKAQQAPWMDLLMYQWAAGQNALAPALVQGRLAVEADLDGGDARIAIALASGLNVDTKSDDYLTQLNPLLVRWAIRELLPPADHPMCGKTAKDFYLAAFSQPTRTMVDVYAQLKARGGLRGVKVDELSKSFDSQKGKYASLCKAISTKTKVQEEAYPRMGACWWWLRRAATSGTDELALLLGTVLRDYDPATYKTYAAALPAELRQKKTR